MYKRVIDLFLSKLDIKLVRLSAHERRLQEAKRVEEELQGLKEDEQISTWVPPGHFYSPLTSDDDFKRFDDRDGVPGIDLNSKSQKKLLREFAAHYKSQPFTTKEIKKNRYYFDNDQFSYSDALSLYCFLVHFKPKNVIEVGSGYSSALMLDVNNQFLDNAMNLTFIEPFPTRLKGLLRDEDNPEIIEDFVQGVPMDRYSHLKKGDILFIDSTHVAKTGSDVNWLYNEVLPTLNKGVIVHVHDIIYPFEYSSDWVKQGRSWNEAYMLRCVLQDSPRYKVLFWDSYLHKHHAKDMKKAMPISTKNTGGSIWFQVV